MGDPGHQHEEQTNKSQRQHGMDEATVGGIGHGGGDDQTKATQDNRDLMLPDKMVRIAEVFKRVEIGGVEDHHLTDQQQQSHREQQPGVNRPASHYRVTV